MPRRIKNYTQCVIERHFREWADASSADIRKRADSLGQLLGRQQTVGLDVKEDKRERQPGQPSRAEMSLAQMINLSVGIVPDAPQKPWIKVH